jgi:predicted O-methyltransferase YrrM
MPGYHWLPDRLKERAQARRGHRDFEELSEYLGSLEPGSRAGRAADGLCSEIPARLEEYVRQTGTDEIMAASVELCDFLVRWCEIRRPARIVDLGSGITSWTLRAWRDRYRPEATVVSVDDDPDWLSRSRAYSKEAGTGDRDFLLWTEFLERYGSDSFDLVVHDFGSVRERARQMGRTFALVAPGGAIVCDDIHKARIWKAARNTMWRLGMTGWSLRAQTLDSIGRFALIAVRPPDRV